MANPSGKVFEIVLRPVQGTATVKTPDGYFDVADGAWVNGREPDADMLAQVKAALADIVPMPSARKRRSKPKA